MLWTRTICHPLKSVPTKYRVSYQFMEVIQRLMKRWVLWKKHIYSILVPSKKLRNVKITPPMGVLNSLQNAFRLREPVLVFPVATMESYQPVLGITENAIYNASLPNAAMITCLLAAVGTAPTLWDFWSFKYVAKPNRHGTEKKEMYFAWNQIPLSTLKVVGAFEGEFVRAEAASCIGDKTKVQRNDELFGQHNRILKILTTKRREW